MEDRYTTGTSVATATGRRLEVDAALFSVDTRYTIEEEDRDTGERRSWRIKPYKMGAKMFFDLVKQ